MTDKELSLIYDYMGWCSQPNGEMCPYCGYIHNSDDILLDSNTAWEVVQEMERKGDLSKLESFIWDLYVRTNVNGICKFIMNPSNFWKCFTKWLSKEE